MNRRTLLAGISVPLVGGGVVVEHATDDGGFLYGEGVAYEKAFSNENGNETMMFEFSLRPTPRTFTA